ncbi:MAG: lysine--tRNA ligase [Verrucomicrobia bacterium]|jgi:lysyl-tRNA synthetase class 2|nr:lysine--tRNA ligase [Verrucomicrobiota bacterium]
MSEKTDLNAISHDLHAVRQEKLAQLRAAGEDPYRAEWSQTHVAAECPALLPEGVEEGPEVSVAGRIVALRVMGKASFVKILDRSGVQQCYFTRDALLERYDTHFKKLVDLGDFVGVRGRLFRTKTGEVTVRATEYKLVSKALRPLPEKWAGLADPEQVYRQRYLDLVVNEESRQRLVTRSRVIESIRKFFWSRQFVEVETPALHAVAGGAAARPFVTHFNALDCDFYLRIALELHLKRCLVGGMDRVFEIGRVFRNEGLSRRHNPEFTMLEAYQAYSDYRGMMELVRSMIQTICREVLGTTTVNRADGGTIELGGEWREAKYKDLILERTGDPQWFSRSKEEKIAACRTLGLEEPRADWEDYEVTNEVFGKLIEPTLIQPTFVTHIPKELCPLAKVTVGDDSTIDVFELCINGQEIAPAYSEQNDPGVQRQMLQLQAGAETQKIDEDFLLALEHGMPPAGGLGVGIDRLVILLTGAANIRDTILFPTLRPEAGA